MADCRICSGPLRLLHRGRGGGAFAPTCHVPGQYGDLLVCARCGSVQQPSLPSGEDLHALYRSMEDPDYLAEEDGRRRTARRLLALVPPGGRLLDVGCGHGLLLDEARALGFSVEGLELSRSAADWARGSLGLPVREEPLEAVDEPAAYAAIVMADVLEHLDDPPAALDHARSLLSPGGVLVVVTPDPASRMARLAGARWWGFLPAHTVLLPRATLRRTLEERGFSVVDERSLVRTFTLRYWMAGLAERGGPAGRVVSLARSVVPARWRVSLSLGDEAVFVARLPPNVPQYPL
jgi:2-polyprenyl-3-methyl-5-hydroxy-6-metoxy-1,4-benzoquinol methylase